MPRGVKGSGKAATTAKTKTIDERIVETDAIISSIQAELRKVKAKRKELVGMKQKADMEAVQKVILDSGITTEELRKLIEDRNSGK